MSSGRPRLLAGWVTPAALAVMFLALPVVFSSSYQRTTLVRFTIVLLLLTGLNLISGYARMTSLAQAGLYGMGAYVAGVLSANHGVPTWLAFLLAPVGAAVVALVVGAPSLRLRGLYFAMATLGAGVVLYLLFGRLVGITGGPNGLLGIPALSVLGYTFEGELPLYGLGAALAFLGLMAARNLERSRTGRALRAVGVSEPAAVVAGVDPFRLRLIAFVLSAVYAGVAGALLTFDTRFVSPSTFSFLTAVVLLVMLTVGGLGTFSGPVIGAALLILLETFLQNYAEYQPLILGILFVIAIQVFPEGIGGWVERRRRPGSAAASDPDGVELVGSTSTGREPTS